jgi:hypothetical protein
MMDSDTTFIEDPTAQDEVLVVNRTSRYMTRRVRSSVTKYLLMCFSFRN